MHLKSLKRIKFAFSLKLVSHQLRLVRVNSYKKTVDTKLALSYVFGDISANSRYCKGIKRETNTTAITAS